MSIASRIEQIEQHLTDDYNVLELAGADLTNIDKNIFNLKASWKERLLYFMNNGTDIIWNNWKKVNGIGTNLLLNNTEKAPMKIELKGNTTQEGTPTPDTPVDIQVVSGDNTIQVGNIINKNDFYIRPDNNTRATNQNNRIEVLSNTSYTIIANNDFNYGYFELDSNLNVLTDSGWKSGTTTFTTKSNTKYLWFNLKYSNNSVITDINNFMKEIGFVLYKENQFQSYSINLGKNLLEPKMPTSTRNGITCTNNGDGTFTLNGTATANADFRLDQSIPTGSDNLKSYDGTYTLSCNELINHTELRVMQIGTWTTALAIRDNNVPVTGTFNLNNCFIYVAVISGQTVNNLTIRPMLEKNSQATSFSPYKTPIELCKIGNYQDRIYKQDVKWYIHKEIGKYICTGNETLSLQNSGKRIHINSSVNSIPDPLHTSSISTKYGMYSNKLVEVTAGNTWNGIQGVSYDYNSGQNIGNIDISINGISTLADYRTAIAGIIIYYILQTSTTTEITDTELISQLEVLKTATSYDNQTNISQENNNLPFIINATALMKNSD